MIIVGEKVNATRKSIKKAIQDRDTEFLANVIKGQEEAGAEYIDVNVGTGSGSQDQEISDMKWLVDLALEATTQKLCLDSADPEVLQAAVRHVNGRRLWMLNSVKGEPGSMNVLLPLIKKHRAPFVALAMDEKGIARDAQSRLKVCEKIYTEIKQRDIDPGLVFFDPLVMPLATDCSQGVVGCECIREIKKRFPEAKTIIGLTNISHGLPARGPINQGFLICALMSGLDAAIVDPTRDEMRKAILIGVALAGNDRHCLRYTRASRREQKRA